MRRLVWLVLAAAVVLCGCGTERPGAARADVSSIPTPSPTSATSSASTPTPTPTPTPTFPLAVGLPEHNENNGSPVTMTSEPATRAFRECGRTVWDPRRGSTEVIGVSFSGEAEWYRGRTLVLYPSAEDAVRAVDTVHNAITNCPRDDGDDDGWTEHTGIDYHAGDESFGYIDRWWSASIHGFDTGLTVYHTVSVGGAVLFTYEYGEGNGGEQSRLQAFAMAAKDDQPVVDAMSVYSA